jgi:type II secretory pathway pseudopilin PulG
MRRAFCRSRPPRALIRGLSRSGMTLVEVIVAMMLLVGVVLVLGGFSAKFVQATAQAHLIVLANDLAATRLDAVRQQYSYTGIDSLAGTNATVQSDWSTYTVTTWVKRVGGGVADTVDYKLVTVTVTHPAMRKVVSKTTAVAAF